MRNKCPWLWDVVRVRRKFKVDVCGGEVLKTSCQQCFWWNSTHTTTSDHSCGPQAMVSWTRPSGSEPAGLWEWVPSGSRFAGCTVPELCSQKPCGDMANPNLSAPTWKPQLTSGTQGRLPLNLWPPSLWPALFSVARRCSKKVPGLQIKDILWVS